MTPRVHLGRPGVPPLDPTGPDPAAKLATLSDVLTTYRTCEFATVNRSGVPITWPAVSWFDPDAEKFVLTTSIGLPRKVVNIRRDPRVALLFSDPTGSGRSDLPQVSVQGTARCPDEIRTSPKGLETYWRTLWSHQPSSAAYGSSPVDRWLFDFYYMRLIITVDPTDVTVRPPLVREGPLTAPRPARRDDSPFGIVCRRLPEFCDGVLATVTEDEPPVLQRVRVSPDPTTQTLMLDGADLTGVAGVASANLLLHSHDDKLGRLRQVGLLGNITFNGEVGVLHPTRVLPGATATTPLSLIRAVRRLRRATERYLDQRGLERPTIPWAEYRELRADS